MEKTLFFESSFPRSQRNRSLLLGLFGVFLFYQGFYLTGFFSSLLSLASLCQCHLKGKQVLQCHREGFILGKRPLLRWEDLERLQEQHQERTFFMRFLGFKPIQTLIIFSRTSKIFQISDHYFSKNYPEIRQVFEKHQPLEDHKLLSKRGALAFQALIILGITSYSFGFFSPTPTVFSEPDLVLKQGQLLASQGKFSQALACYQSLSDSQSAKHPQVYALRGDYYFQRKYYLSAISEFTQFLAHQKSASLLKYRALSYEALGNLPAFLEDSHKLVHDFPQDPDSYEFQGRAYFLQEQYPEALLAYEQAVSKAKEAFSLLYQKAYILFVLGHFKEALLLCETLLQKNPSHEPTQLLQALLLIRKGEIEKAKICFETHLNLTTPSPLSFMALWYVLLFPQETPLSQSLYTSQGKKILEEQIQQRKEAVQEKKTQERFEQEFRCRQQTFLGIWAKNQNPQDSQEAYREAIRQALPSLFEFQWAKQELALLEKK
jgi:tetratricopeptide (TPR) repeat protein